jgi:hypothetical protein
VTDSTPGIRRRFGGFHVGADGRVIRERALILDSSCW